MVIISNTLINLGNSDIVNAAANISQFINVWQSTKSATYSQLASEIVSQNQLIENKIDEEHNKLLNILISEIKVVEEQNEEIIKQNEEIIKQNDFMIDLLKSKDI